MRAAEFVALRKKFVATVVGLAVASVVGLGFILYETNAIRFNSDIGSEQLHSVVSEDPAVVDYLEQEKDFEAHFITIANLIKSDQQQTLGRSLILVTIPVVILAGIFGYLIARRLLKPVEESYESQERFIADAAHELRNPLAAMSVALQATDQKGTSKKELVQAMKRQTRRLVKMNEDLLFLERRAHSDEVELVNVSELLLDVLEDLQPLIARKKLELDDSTEQDIQLRIRIQDFVRLSKNIIENAVKYTPSGRTVQVALYKDSGKIVLEVEDQGIGIPEEDVEMLGQRFFRSSNVSRIDGSGLGLSIVHKILDRYHGSISISSQLKKGTKVIVKL